MEFAAEGAHVVLALAQADAGDSRRAVQTCERFRRAFPNAPRGPGALAYALAKAGAVKRARRVLQTAGKPGAEPFMLANRLRGTRQRGRSISVPGECRLGHHQRRPARSFRGLRSAQVRSAFPVAPEAAGTVSRMGR